jgi:hypothetical protein
MSSQNSDSNEYLELDILSFGYWFVQIEKYNLTSHGNYSLLLQTSSITSTDPTLIQNDANTGSDAGNSFNSATEITQGLHYGMLVDFDYYDYYKISLIQSDEILIRISFQESLNFDLFFYSPSNERIDSSTLGHGSESTFTVVQESGSFKILVSRLTGVGAYELYIQVSHPRELDFNWKALVAFGVVLVVLIGVFLTIRYFRMRTPPRIQQSPIKDKSKQVERKDHSPEEQEIISCDDALVESGKDLSDEEREALDKILKGYSISKDKK